MQIRQEPSGMCWDHNIFYYYFFDQYIKTDTKIYTLYYSEGPLFQKKFVGHFLVEFVMQLFLHSSNMMIPNLPHAKLYF